MPRVPYAEQPDIVERHCTCDRVEVVEQMAGELPRRIDVPGLIDPDCPLHSPDARFDVPEGL